MLRNDSNGFHHRVVKTHDRKKVKKEEQQQHSSSLQFLVLVFANIMSAATRHFLFYSYVHLTPMGTSST